VAELAWKGSILTIAHSPDGKWLVSGTRTAASTYSGSPAAKSSIDLNRPRPSPDDLARVRQWAIRHLAMGEDPVVVVNELACREPGCPPIETVIGVLTGGWRATIHKPASRPGNRV
jgi:hypothetical protein